MWNDLSHALRSVFRRSHRSTVLTVATLTIGLGIGTTIYTIADSIVFRAMPFGNQDRLVAVWATAPAKGVDHLEINWSDLERLEEDTGAFESFGAWAAANVPVVFAIENEPSELPLNMVSAHVYDMLEVRPAEGRLFGPEDREAGSASVLISYDLWQRQFGGDPAVIGRVISAAGEPAEIIGVLPQHLDFPRAADVVVPLEVALADPASREYRTLVGLALLAEGVTLEQARRRVTQVAARIAEEKPSRHEGVGAALEPLRDQILGPLEEILKLMFAMGLLLIVIAWVNVAGTLLTQSLGRRREFAVRLGLGASTFRIARQLFFELVLIGGIAFVGSWIMVRLAVRVTLRLAPEDLPRLAEISIGPRSLWFLGLSTSAGVLLLTLVLVLQLSRMPLGRALVESGTRVTLSGRIRGALDGLVTIQIALALVLLIVAAAFSSSFRELSRIDPGFDREGVITAHLPLGYLFGEAAEERREFLRLFLERVEELPGVSAAGTVLMRPLEIEQGWDLPFTVEGQDMTEHETNPMGNLLSVTPRYFEAIGLDLIAGRSFGKADVPEADEVTVVSRSFADRYWSEPREAIDRRIKRGRPDEEHPWLRIVGVVEDGRYRGLTSEKLDVYVPHTQTNWSPNYLAVRAKGDPAATVEGIRNILTEMRPDVPLASVRTSAELVDRHLAQPRLNAVVSAGFAGSALLVSLAGLYSALSYGVYRRSSEFGIRLALGATPAAILRMVLRESLVIALCGSLAGVAAIAAAGILLGTVITEIAAVEPVTVAVCGVSLMIVAIVASLRPAIQAMRVSPAEIVRSE